ncbi:DNA-directed RNA polymerase subunit alpha [Mycobacterium tuberculosis CCDC5079]|nr:DNA-directed RNA polymerase subunit alpha [Mycobacterium tuberculosis CCDC5079]
MLISQRPTLSEDVLTDNRSQFVIEPLEPGFGYTLGNSLRRTLLSSIPGAAVTSIRIDGVLHEFTTVPGVKEDVTEIILNLKSLVVSSEEDEPVTMYLRKQGPGEVTAGDIVPPAGVTVHNPGMHIATLNDKGKLEVELVVERGRGYVPAVQNRASGAEIGRIPVDSIYSPVLKVTYKVDATRVEQRHRLRQADPGRGDQEFNQPARRAGVGWQDAGRVVRPGTGTQRRGRRHRDRAVAGRGRSHCVIRPADRRPGSDGAVLQLPQARGGAHRGRTGGAHRIRPA